MGIAAIIIKALWPVVKDSFLGRHGFVTVIKKKKMIIFLAICVFTIFFFFLYMSEVALHEAELYMAEKKALETYKASHQHCK